jgi:hypothetical protein
MPGGYGGYPGMPGGAGMPGMPGAAATGEEETENSETTWWYHYPQKGIHYAFLFNNQGRVIQIQQYGFPADKTGKPTRGTFKTAQGITLGSSAKEVIQRYGFSTDGERAGEVLTLRYGGRQRLAFQLFENRVAGITLAVVNN